jgi:hypothetical protein
MCMYYIMYIFVTIVFGINLQVSYQSL